MSTRQHLSKESASAARSSRSKQSGSARMSGGVVRGKNTVRNKQNQAARSTHKTRKTHQRNNQSTKSVITYSPATYVASKQPAVQSARNKRAGRKLPLLNRIVQNTPARFMQPRVIFLLLVIALTGFGLVMIFSASSITAMTSDALGNDPTYYLKRQVIAIVPGVAFCVALACFDYHWLVRGYAPVVLYGVAIMSLVLVLPFIAGQSAFGASRWISFGGFTIQPSEFAKVIGVIIAAWVLHRYVEEGSLDSWGCLKRLLGFLGFMVILILVQPDKGTVFVLGATLLVMLYLAGIPGRYLGVVFVVGALGLILWSLKDAYSLRRIVVLFNPWEDYYNSGYQLIQGFYAFGLGGIGGVGVGLSHQKYSYLPMAHNDFIFAIIGEECGFIGCMLVLMAFFLLAYMALKIAHHATDTAGKLIASGCGCMFLIQTMINVAGVVGIFPLSGKPIPFLSYGGSSILSSFIAVGLVLSVSIHSQLPQTKHDRTRKSFTTLLGGASQVRRPRGNRGQGLMSEASRAHGRSARTTHANRARTVNVFATQTQTQTQTKATSAQTASMQAGVRLTTRLSKKPRHKKPEYNVSGAGVLMHTMSQSSIKRTRINLGPTAADRLRGSSH